MRRNRRRPVETRRFRRRLTAAFVITAAVSSGILAVTTYTLASSYRWRNFRDAGHDEARLALALAPAELTETSFDRLLGAYHARVGTDTVAESPHDIYSSSTLTLDDVPPELRAVGPGELATVTTSLPGAEYVVVGGAGPGGVRYYFFFATDQVRESLAELRVFEIVGWAVVLLGAAAAGDLVARRTLAPVRAAADASAAIAEGLLDTRLQPAGADEFGAWAVSFNRMATALEHNIALLRAAAERERRFSSDVAHELRTPLTGLVATASLLEEDLASLPPSVQGTTAVLIHDVRRLRDLVLELLELSRLDRGGDPPATEVLHLRPAVAAVIDGLPVPGCPVEVRIPEDLVVGAERARLRRVLTNLIQNGFIHGGGQVTVEAAEHDGRVRVAVLDEGPGIPVDDLPHVFDRFYKSDRSRASGGSGLGLAIARQHAEAMGGGLAAENRPGGGARLILELPRSATDTEASCEGSDRDTSPRGRPVRFVTEA